MSAFKFKVRTKKCTWSTFAEVMHESILVYTRVGHGLDSSMDWIGLDWIGLDWIGSNFLVKKYWILDWIELDWIGSEVFFDKFVM